jgi:hypothetical protein
MLQTAGREQQQQQQQQERNQKQEQQTQPKTQTLSQRSVFLRQQMPLRVQS